MEKDFNKEYENPDPWREAILAERRNPSYEPMFMNALQTYEGKRDNALILGDASLVQSQYLLEKENFAHVTDVDISPTLLDDEIVRKDDVRLKRIVCPFDQYEYSGEKFDLIYGKSIAFNPKETIQKVLQNISQTLNDEGIFFAVFAGEGDIFRQGIIYTLEEITMLYKNANLEILKVREFNKPAAALVKGHGIAHEFKILAQKIITDL